MPTKKVTKKVNKAQELDKKFKRNNFAKKYKKDLDEKYAQGFNEGALAQIETLESAEQVKSWSRHERAIICDNLADIVLAAVVGLIVGVLLTINL